MNVVRCLPTMLERLAPLCWNPCPPPVVCTGIGRRGANLSVKEGKIALRVPYCGPPPPPADLLGQWNFDPLLLTALAAGLLLVLAAARDQRLIGTLAIAALAVIFVSPLCAAGSALFSARAVHHVLLVTVAAPLFALLGEKSRTNGTALALLVSTIVLWAWHIPALYTAALNNHAVFWLMQLSLLISATWFWRALFAAQPDLPAVFAALVAAAGQMGLLGALLTFTPRALYPHHLIAPFAYGLDPLRDQQLAGLIMWVPAMLPYALIAAVLARRAWSGGHLGPAR
ncbi:hypothetical protein GCM10011393_10830 [Sphingopyxis bauzanensis]|nr:hypothetical protein GCM10011393_10830 [Sphingopyxis bauzanensis]